METFNPPTLPQRQKRSFLKEDFVISNWEEIKPYYDKLLLHTIGSEKDLIEWFRYRSELESAISEDMGWRYIKMTCDTTAETHLYRFQQFISEIEPNIAPYTDKLNKKAFDSPYFQNIKEPGYEILRRTIAKDIQIFREDNIPLYTEIQTDSQKYGAISGAMTVIADGKELTLPVASDMLQATDRSLREIIYKKIYDRRLQDSEELNDLYTKLIQLRNQVALNAGFKNFRDYMFTSMGRFDYSVQDCRNFHESVEQEVVPLLNELIKQRKELLNVDALRPWDLKVDEKGREALKPFKNTEELTKNTIALFNKIDPILGDYLTIMREMGHLDLDCRKGKAPGGYNYPLAEIGVPFIFMNATSNLRDLVTILHEGGHAIHSFVTRDLPLNDFKNTPSEVAELASMSMELISMDYWDIYFDKEADLKRAKIDHLKQIIETLPWVATIDKFQHWVYENPSHSIQERTENWNRIHNTFSDKVVDWSNLQDYKDIIWQKQLHLYEVPFYYIEYGMAQLGAIAVWKNYKDNKAKGLEGYLNALRLGYTQSIPQIYNAANVKFDFSKHYIKELMTFIKEELNSLMQ